MLYTVKLRRAARRSLARIEKDIHQTITASLRCLETNARPHGVLKLKGSDLWRIRVGSYRIVYHIDDDQKVVTVLRVGHRWEVYR